MNSGYINDIAFVSPASSGAAVVLFGFMFWAWHAKPALLHMDIKI